MTKPKPGTCSMHNEPLIREEGGDDRTTVFGRFYCPKCSKSLMRALDDVAAGRLHDLDDVIEDFGFTRAELEEEIETTCELCEDCIAGPDHEGTCRFPSWENDIERPLVDFNLDRDEWVIFGERPVATGANPHEEPRFEPATTKNLALLIARGAKFTDRALVHIAGGFI